MTKNFVILAFTAFILLGCFTPSRQEPSIKVYSMNNMGRTYVTSRTVHIPTPLPYKYEFGGAWEIRMDIFSLEQELSAFSVFKDDKKISIRGARKDYLAQDSSFTVAMDVSDEEFVRFYLNWDMDYWKNKLAEAVGEDSHGINYTVGEITYNSEKKFGTMNRVLPQNKTCTLASIQGGDYIYIISGTTSAEDDDDMCEVITEIWNDRAEF